MLSINMSENLFDYQDNVYVFNLLCGLKGCYGTSNTFKTQCFSSINKQ